MFVNAVDDPANASLYLGGVVRRGGVTAAISTDGRAPALAGLIREALEALLPEDEVRRWLAAADDELIPIFPRDLIHVVVVGGETNGYWRIFGNSYQKTVSIDEWR